MKAVVYLRVSTEEQRERQSIATQLEFARSYCRLHGIHVVAEYSDDGVSGAIPMENRPAGKQLLLDAAKGAFDTLLVYRIDRIARSTLELLRCVDSLERLDVATRSMSEPFETSTSVGKFVLTLLGSIAQLERDAIRERCMLGKARHARDGKWVGGKPPLGYRVGEDGKLEIEPFEACQVQRIFRLYVEEGLGTVPIADILTAEGVPLFSVTRGVRRVLESGRWNAGHVARILHNTAYSGKHVWRKTQTIPSNGDRKKREVPASEDQWIVTEVPALVSQEMFDAAQQKAQRNFAMARRNAKRDYLLRGLVTCGRCGRAYVGDGQHSQGRFYYRCTGTNTFRGAAIPKCESAYVRAEVLEDLVWQDVSAFCRDPGPVLDQLMSQAKVQVEAQASVEAEQAELDTVLQQKQAERQRVIGLMRRGIITETEAETELLQLQREVEALELRRDGLFSQRAQAQNLEQRLLNASVVLAHLRDAVEQADAPTKQAVLQALVKRVTIVTVDEQGEKVPHVTITYCFEPPVASGSSTGLPRPVKPA